MPRKPDESRRDEARRLYRLGLDTRAVAAQLDADPRTVARWLGDEVRRRGPHGRIDVQDQRILDLRDHAGPADAEREAKGLPSRGKLMSWEEIGRAVGMSKTGVRMRYYALTGRPRPDRVPQQESRQP